MSGSILGPIASGSSFLIVSVVSSTPYVLNGALDSDNDLFYYWEKNISNIIEGTTGQYLPVFMSFGSLSSMTIQDTNPNNGGGINFLSNNITISNGNQPATVKMTLNNQYAPWFTPTLFLSGATYTIYAPSGGVAGIINSNDISGATVPANNLLILPVTWYGNCSNGTYDQVTNSINSLLNWLCMVAPQTPICSEAQLLPRGWTVLTECFNDYIYSYCPINDACGTNNCNGPCSAIYYDCNYSNGNFGCVFDPEKFIVDTQWWESPYFIGFVVLICLMALIVFMIIILLISKGRSSPKQ